MLVRESGCLEGKLKQRGFTLPDGRPFHCLVGEINPPTEDRVKWNNLNRIQSPELFEYYRERGMGYSEAYRRASFIRNGVAILVAALYGSDEAIGNFYRGLSQSSVFLLCNLCQQIAGDKVEAIWRQTSAFPAPGRRRYEAPINSSNKIGITNT